MVLLRPQSHQTSIECRYRAGSRIAAQPANTFHFQPHGPELLLVGDGLNKGADMTSAGNIYERTGDEWDEMREAAERFLISLAENRGMTDYSNLNRAIAEQTGCRPFDYRQESERAAVGRLLGEISIKTNEQHGVMLSALVTHQGSNDEGGGFYKLAADLGKMPKKPTQDEKLVAFVRLTKEVHQHYSR